MGEYSEWVNIAENTDPDDTTYDDTGVEEYYTYRYKLTAYDTLRNESFYSDSEQLYITHWDNPDRGIERMEILLPPIITNKSALAIRLNKGIKNVSLTVYNCAGQLISNQVLLITGGSMHRIDLLKDSRNKTLSNGIYFIRIKATEIDEVKKFTILR